MWNTFYSILQPIQTNNVMFPASPTNPDVVQAYINYFTVKQRFGQAMKIRQFMI